MGEQKLFDSEGKFALVVKDGRRLNSITWNSCRVLLSTKQFLFISGDKKKRIPLQTIQNIGGRFDVNQTIAELNQYLSLTLKSGNVIIVHVSSSTELREAFFEAVLQDKKFYIKHPAIEGGVITDEKWQKSKINIEPEEVDFITKQGNFIEIKHTAISNLEIEQRSIKQRERTVLSVTHTPEETSIETYIASTERKMSFVRQHLKKGEQQNTVTNMEFTEDEKEVLMGLYSGVDPFQMSSFTELDVETVEEIYQDLLEKDVIDLVRERKDVQLTSRGRNLASEAMNEK